MSFWLPFLFSILGLLANDISLPPYCLSKGGNKRFFSDVISFKDGSGSLKVVLCVGTIDSSSGSCLLVLHLERYLGFGKLPLSELRFWGKLIVLSNLSYIFYLFSKSYFISIILGKHNS